MPVDVLRGKDLTSQGSTDIIDTLPPQTVEASTVTPNADVSAPLPSRAARAIAKPRPEPPRSTQGISRKKIAKTLRKVMLRVRRCYERELKSNPRLSGKVVARIDAAANGKVENVTVQRDSLNNQATTVCIVWLLRRLEFPPSSDGRSMRFSVPLSFEPEGR